MLRKLVVLSGSADPLPPAGYSGLGRLAWAAATEYALQGVEVELVAAGWGPETSPVGLPFRVRCPPPDPEAFAGADAFVATDAVAASWLPSLLDARTDAIVVVEQYAPWLHGPRGPGVRHVVFRSDRLPSFAPGEAWLCDPILVAGEVGPPLPSDGGLLWLGRVHPDKNPAALSALARALPDRELVVAGPSHIEEPEWPPNVRRIGPVDGRAKRALLCAAEAFLYTVEPRWTGACEVVLAEAAACGLPILAQSSSAGCPARRVVLDGVNGFCRGSPAELAALAPALRGVDRVRLHETFGARLDPSRVAADRLERMEDALALLRGVQTPRRALAAARLDRAGRIEATGDLDRAEALYTRSAVLARPPPRRAQTIDALLDDAAWIRLDARARALEQGRACEGLWRYLVANDERQKALALTGVLPWTLDGHPVARALDAWAKPVRRHLEDPSAYLSWYAADHIAEPVPPSPDPRTWLPRAVDAARIVADHAPDGRVLEVGCYDGPIGLPVLVCCPRVRYVGVDPNAPARVRFREAAAQFSDRLELHAEAGEPDGSFDVVLWTEVIEHVARPELELRALLRWLKPGGLLFLTTPWGSYELGRPPQDPFAPDALGHVRAIGPLDLLACADAAAARCLALWRSPTGIARGDGLHAILRPGPAPVDRVALLDGAHHPGVLRFAAELARTSTVELYTEVVEPRVVDEVRVFPAAWSWRAKGRRVMVAPRP